MSEQVRFLNMFPDFQPPEEVEELLSQAVIGAADIDPAARKVSVAIHTPKYIPQRLLDQAAQTISNLYGLSLVELIAT